MVLPSIEATDPAAADPSRWVSMRVMLPNEVLRLYWSAWSVGTWVSAFASAVVILLILARPALRAQTFNKFILGLALSGCIFSSLCGCTCLAHALAGHWAGGHWMCITQGWYVVYGMAASIWMNLLIAHELHRLASAADGVNSYQPLPARTVWGRIAAVHAAAVLFGALPLCPGLPIDVGRLGGLGCLPVEYDGESTIFHWVVTMNFLYATPIVSILYYFKRTHDHLRRAATSELAGVDRTIVSFFGRLLCAFLFTWTPSAFGIWVSGNGHGFFWTGMWVHLAGLVSAGLSLMKPDINAEFRCVSRGALAALRACLKKSRCGSAAEEGPEVRAEADVEVAAEAIGSNGTGGDESVVMTQQVLSALSEALLTEIRARELLPMEVVECTSWRRAGHIPRSSEALTRPWRDGDTVIFVSHRWWDSTCPDDGEGTKYRRISRGVAKLVSLHGLDSARLVLWIDWACISQDDAELQRRGISSLITYAARADFVIVPVRSGEASAKAFGAAEHPMELHEYGDRAWCRLEVYIFSCVAEASLRAPLCYGFGPVGTRCSLLGEERLRLLFSNSERGATFDLSALPSAGALSVEADRVGIREVENDMREIRVKCAILEQRLTLQTNLRRRKCVLVGKQLRCADAPQLVREMFRGSWSARIAELHLDGNLLSELGVEAVMRDIVCSLAAPALTCLSLSNNPKIGTGGLRIISGGLKDPTCNLRTLLLSRCALSTEATGPLCESIPLARTLTRLDLSHNRIDDTGCKRVLEACGGYEKPVVTIDMEGNPLSPSSLACLARARAAIELGQGGRPL